MEGPTYVWISLTVGRLLLPCIAYHKHRIKQTSYYDVFGRKFPRVSKTSATSFIERDFFSRTVKHIAPEGTRALMGDPCRKNIGYSQSSENVMKIVDFVKGKFLGCMNSV